MKPSYISTPDWEILQKKYPNKEELINKLQSGYPSQYLIGNVEFLNTIIDVDERVLIPRYETEYLVDKTIHYANNLFNKPLNIIDLGTGSGCIAIALKKNLDSKVSALDISIDAINLAKENAQKNNVDITFINESMTNNLTQNYDIIISNPPYISYNGYVEEKVLKNEPNIALFAPDDGIYFYKEIINKHYKNLNSPGIMAFEIGDNQKDKLKELVTNYKHSFENDLQGLPRYLFIFK